MMSWYAITSFYHDITEFWMQLPIDIISFLLLWVLIWKGTKYEILFTKVKMTMVLVCSIVDIGFSLV